MLWNWLRRHPYLLDGVIVLALAAGYVGSAAHSGVSGRVPLAVLIVAPLIVRRRYPVGVLAAVTVATALSYVIYSIEVPAAAAVAVYTTAAHLARRAPPRRTAPPPPPIPLPRATSGPAGRVLTTPIALGAAAGVVVNTALGGAALLGA